MDQSRLLWAAQAILLLSSSCMARASHDYAQALDLTLQFFEAQRSGPLPANQRANWRGDSGLSDGKREGVDLTGGYYDAGDNVKFGFPMAFTLTMLSWGTIEYQSQMKSVGQLQHALDAIKWGTDYLIKAHPEPNVLWAEVGDGASDHSCWQRPEDMTTSRQAYKVDANNPGSDVAAETAAAMAAASIVFKDSDAAYSGTLLAHAKQLFTFADNYKGTYNNAVPVVQRFYSSGPSGYSDELLWAALWLFEATGDQFYLDYACNNADALGGTSSPMTEFSWDVKFVGVQILASKILLQGRGGTHAGTLTTYQNQASFFMCAAVNKNTDRQMQRTQGGLYWLTNWNNIQSASANAFLVTVYGDWLAAANKHLSCSGADVLPSELFNAGKSQVDYILGNNPKGMSYMVGYGSSYPRFVHHRGASIVSIKQNPEFVSCGSGYSDWFNSAQPNINVLAGALVGGPDQNDNYVDSRSNFAGNEPTTYNSAPFVGLLARLSSAPSSSTTVRKLLYRFIDL